MAKNKKAQIYIVSVYAYCPECSGCLLSANGSYIINIFDTVGDEKYTCEKCGKKWPIDTK